MSKIEYPYDIKYRKFGEHYLLVYSDYDNYNNIIVAKYYDSIIRTANHLIDKRFLHKAKRLLKVDIVYPSEKTCKAAAKSLIDSYANIFVDVVVHDLSEIKLRNKFKKCKKYNNKYDNTVEEEYDPFHSSCKNCLQGLNLGITKKQFFEQYYSKYVEGCKKFNITPYEFKYGTEFATPPPRAKDNEKVYDATNLAGFKSVLQPVQHTVFLTNNYNFFFKILYLDKSADKTKTKLNNRAKLLLKSFAQKDEELLVKQKAKEAERITAMKNMYSEIFS